MLGHACTLSARYGKMVIDSKLMLAWLTGSAGIQTELEWFEISVMNPISIHSTVIGHKKKSALCIAKTDGAHGQAVGLRSCKRVIDDDDNLNWVQHCRSMPSTCQKKSRIQMLGKLYLLNFLAAAT